MDNLTHSLVGWALAETGLKRRTRKGVAACVLAANMPDIDVFFGWVPWAPLAMHRGFTHGLVGGVLILPPVLALLLVALDRWQHRRKAPPADAPPLRYGWLALLCWLGALTHPLLDMQNTYAVQLLSPASTRWFHADGLFIVSPWLLAVLGAGLWRARRHGSARAAQLAVAGTIAFIALNIGISALAWQAPGRDAPYARPDRVFASPEPLAFWRREVVWRENGMIGRGVYDPLRAPLRLLSFGPVQADGMDDPLIPRAVAASPRIAHFLEWSQLPVAQVARKGCNATVTFGDARFGSAMARGAFIHVVTVPDDGPRCAGQHAAGR